jgi:hypothetical protein
MLKAQAKDHYAGHWRKLNGMRSKPLCVGCILSCESIPGIAVVPGFNQGLNCRGFTPVKFVSSHEGIFFPESGIKWKKSADYAHDFILARSWRLS